MKRFRPKYYEEIKIPHVRDLDPSLKPFFEKKLSEDRNIVCLFMLLSSALYLTFKLSPYAKELSKFIEAIPFLGSPFVTSFLVTLIFSFLIVVIKKSAKYKLYQIPELEGEKPFWVQRISKSCAKVFSILIAAFFEISRVLLLDIKNKNNPRPQAIIIPLLVAITPYVYKTDYLTINTMFLTYSILFPLFLVFVYLLKRVIFSAVFSSLSVRSDSIKSMEELKESFSRVFQFYKENSKNLSRGDISLTPKGLSTAGFCYLASSFLKISLYCRDRNQKLDKIFVLGGQFLLYARNASFWLLVNWNLLAILVIELVIGLVGLWLIREALVQGVVIYKNFQLKNIFNFEQYKLFFEHMIFLSASTVTSHSWIKSSLFSKRLQECLVIINKIEFQNQVKIAKKHFNSNPKNPSRRKIGLIRS